MKLVVEVLVVYVVGMSLTIGFVVLVNRLVGYVKERIERRK